MDPNNGYGPAEHTLGSDSATLVGNFIPPKGYALSGKIMLAAIILLFFVVLLLFILHLYIRWYLHRLRRRRRRHRGRQLVFATGTQAATATAASGLDLKTIQTIPVYTYCEDDGDEFEVVECSVCLCEFEAGEKVRRLPVCGHRFHVECIDMWFHSHATCPLCRAGVEPVVAGEGSVVIDVTDGNAGCPMCSGAASSSTEMRVEIPARGGRMGAIRRMLSMESFDDREGVEAVDVERGEGPERPPPTPSAAVTATAEEHAALTVVNEVGTWREAASL